MKIHVGSTNENKVGAVRELCASYAMFVDAEVEGKEVDSGVSNQPMTLEETIAGATNRAKACFPGSDFSFGIEAGLIDAPGVIGGKMNLQVCAIFDGTSVFHGLSSGFGIPKPVLDIMHAEGLELDVAAHKAGITEDPRIGKRSGLIALFTRGRVDRKALVKQAIQMAMIHVEKR